MQCLPKMLHLDIIFKSVHIGFVAMATYTYVYTAGSLCVIRGVTTAPADPAMQGGPRTQGAHAG